MMLHLPQTFALPLAALPFSRPLSLLAFSALAALPLLLGGCGSMGEAKETYLEGKRLDITLQPSNLKVSEAAGKEEFALPQPTALADWPQRGANASHTPGHVSLPESVVRLWSANIGGGAGRGQALLNPPVVHSGRLFMIDTSGQVSALNAKSGQSLWRVRLPIEDKGARGIAGGLAVSGNLLFITTGNGQVFALTANEGKAVWDINLNVPLRAAPAVEGESLFITSHDNRLFVLSALNGALQWTHSGVEETLTLLAGTSPAVGNGLVAVPYSSGEVYVLQAADGRYLWHDTLASPFSGRDPALTLSSIAAPPVIADGLLYVVGMNGGLSAYNLANGQRFWRNGITGSQMPLVAGAHMFVVTEAGELVAMNRRDGAIRWVKALNEDLPEIDGKRVWSGPVLAGGRLIVASNDGTALSIEPKTGRQLAATQIDDGVAVAPVVAGGMLYFVTDAGRLVAFGSKD